MITTEHLAAQLNIQPQSIRARLCRMGSYFGLRPIKLPNRRLMWDEDDVTLFLQGNQL